MRRIRWADLLAINLFWLGLNIRNNAVGTIFMPYLVDAFVRQDIKNTALGALRFAGLVIAMLVQPAAGLLSDRNTSRFGRRRPYIAAGVVLDLLFLAAVGLSWNYVSLMVAIILLQFSSNISHGPLQGLIPDLVPESQRSLASAIKSIFELLPTVLVGFTIAQIVGAGSLFWAMVATGGALLLTMLLTLVFVKEEPLAEKPNLPLGPPMVRVLGMLVGILAGGLGGVLVGAAVGAIIGLVVWPLAGKTTALMVGVGLGGLVAMTVAVGVGVYSGVSITLGRSASQEQTSFTWWVINRLLFLAAITSIQGSAPYFLEFAFHIGRNAAVDLTGRLMVMVGAFILLTAIPGGWLSDRFGARRVIGLSGLVAAAGDGLLLLTVFTPNLALIYVAGSLLGLGTGVFMTANWALGTDLIPAKEAGRYLGVSNLAGAGAGMVGASMGGPIADYLNSLLPGLGYFTLFAIYGILFLFSALSLRPVVFQPKTLLSDAPAGSAQSLASSAAGPAGPVENGQA